jgi:prepilin-type N-terminal cleavage/methylation domain-containing protein
MSAAQGVGVRRNGGFTLLELMIAVAILGILAGILVLNFLKPTRRVKTGAEARAVFGEFHRAQEQYKTENGSYLASGAAFPTGAGEQAVDVGVLPSEWTDLHIQLQTTKLYCSYLSEVGTADDPIPAYATDFGMTQPTTSWYTIYATCNADGKSDVDTEYFSSSVDVSLQKKNEGR